MNLSKVSLMTTNQSVGRQTESQSAQDNNSNSAGWKYVTVQEGDTVYTYIVIGKNMKVLIGESSIHEDKDKKTASNKKDAAGNSDQINATVQDTSNKMPNEQINFLADHRMLGLTGDYQKKMREMMKNMEDHIAYHKVDQTNAKAKDEH